MTCAPRKVLTSATLAMLVVGSYLISRGDIYIFQRSSNMNDNVNVALYLLSTLAQSMATILGITIAVIFIAAQINTRQQFSRTLVEIYRAKATFFGLASMLISVSFSVISLSALGAVIKNASWWVIDLNILLFLSAMALLIPLILEQLENINPYALAQKLAGSISTNRILGYGLARVIFDPIAEKVTTYELRRFGYGHGAEDPLGAIHELIMGAVANQDRVQLAVLVRTLLKRIATACGVPYRIAPSPDQQFYRGPQQFVYRVFVRPERIDRRFAITLHLLHYAIRRSFNLKKEWGNKDFARQTFVIAIRDLIESLSVRISNAPLVDLCLYAILHVCLGYRDVMRQGRSEPLLSLFLMTDKLYACGMLRQANLSIDVLACLTSRTLQLSGSDVETDVSALSPELFSRYSTNTSLALSDPQWLPGEDIADPWRHRLSEYSNYSQAGLSEEGIGAGK